MPAERPADIWARCAALWARLFVLALPLLDHHAEVKRDVEYGLLVALGRRVEEFDDGRARLERFAVADDGSSAWGYAIDLVTSLVQALRRGDPSDLLRQATSAYLDSVRTEIANDLSTELGRPISEAELNALIGDSRLWLRAQAFAASLAD